MIKKPSSRPLVTTFPNTHFVLWVELLSNSHNFLVSFFGFTVLFFAWVFGKLSWATMSWLCHFFYDFGAPFPFFWFTYPNSRLFCLNFCSILAAYWYAVPSEEMSRNYIYSWMYLCRHLRYFNTKCFSEYLIPSFVHKVWNIFVSSCTSWSLYCHSVVHCMYLSS